MSYVKCYEVLRNCHREREREREKEKEKLRIVLFVIHYQIIYVCYESALYSYSLNFSAKIHNLFYKDVRIKLTKLIIIKNVSILLLLSISLAPVNLTALKNT